MASPLAASVLVPGTCAPHRGHEIITQRGHESITQRGHQNITQRGHESITQRGHVPQTRSITHQVALHSTLRIWYALSNGSSAPVYPNAPRLANSILRVVNCLALHTIAALQSCKLVLSYNLATCNGLPDKKSTHSDCTID